MKKLFFIIALCIALTGCNDNSNKENKTNAETSDADVKKGEKAGEEEAKEAEKKVENADESLIKSDIKDAEGDAKSSIEVDQNLLPEKVGKYYNFYDMSNYADNIVVIKFISENGIKDANHNYEVKITEVIKGNADKEGTHILALPTETEMGSKEIHEGDRALLMYNDTEDDVIVPMEPDLSILPIEKNKLLLDKNTSKLFKAPSDATLPVNEIIKSIKENN